jgi:tetratricopeptide (TPR) repeat protein
VDASVDVFISHCPADAEWAASLAARIEDAGLRIFLWEWDVVPGDVMTRKIDQALREARAAVVVVSHAAAANLESFFTREYPTIAELAEKGGLRMIPVLRDGAAMPPTLASRHAVSFVGAASEADYGRCFDELLAALRDAPPRRAPASPIAFDRIPDGPVCARLRVGGSTTELAVDGVSTTAVGQHRGITMELRRRMYEAERAGARAGAARRDPAAAGTGGDADPEAALRRLGRALGEAFLPGPVADALAELVLVADRRNSPVELAVEVDADDAGLADLPWEAVIPPDWDTPLVLHRLVRLYRHVAVPGPTPQRRIPGPLRVLAVIASPDRGGGELLDYEHELATILDQLDPARRAEAVVRILEWGSVRSIREALDTDEHGFHILHVSCHAEPGELVLETPQGAEHRVDAEEFVRSVLVPGKGVPLIVLAGCSTALSALGRGGSGGAALPGLATTLLGHGVPAVLAMTAPVSDLYATDVLARTYGALARRAGRADPLAALSQARREVEDERAGLEPGGPRADLAEWATPALFSRGRTPALFDPADRVDPPRRPRRAAFAKDVVALDLGEFVGRRVEMRRLLRTLREGRKTGVLIHGIGGVGKSSLAVQLVRMLEAERRLVMVSLHGPHTVDEILYEIGKRLRRTLGRDALDADRELKETVEDLAEQTLDWDERLGRFAEVVLADHEVLLFLDDPLGDPLRTLADGAVLADADDADGAPDDELRAFLGEWLAIREGVRLVVTVRYQNSLFDGKPPQRMEYHHLGPLSPAETRKLVWRLPAVYALGRTDRDRAYRDLGGHPRAMEYLDAWLSGARGGDGAGRAPAAGVARSGARARRLFDDVAERMEHALRGRDVADPRAWIRRTGADVEAAIAETVATVSAEVLLKRLYDRLRAAAPQARALFVAASVFRQPVGPEAFTWVLTDIPPPEPDCAARLREIYDLLLARKQAGRGRSVADLDLDLGLSPGRLAQHRRDVAARSRPPDRPELRGLRERLLSLTLLAPVGDADDEHGERFLVHRWTAHSLRSFAGDDDVDEDLDDELHQAHRRAGAYRRWRAELYQREPFDSLDDLEEARYHLWTAGDAGAAVAVTIRLCTQLHARGAFTWEWRVCAETVARLGEHDPRSRVFLHFMAVIDTARGDYGDAERRQRACLEIAVRTGDAIAQAASRQQLGVIAQMRDTVGAAEHAYHQARRLCTAAGVADRPGARAVLATCYIQLGGLALDRGDHDSAHRWATGALAIADEILDEAEIAEIDRELEKLARAFGAVDLAEAHARRVREIIAAGRETPRLAATSALVLGAANMARDDPREALDHLKRAAELAEDLGDRPLFARCLHLLADVLFELKLFEAARERYRECIEIAEDVDDRAGRIVAEQQLGRLAAEDGDLDDAADILRRALTNSENLGNPGLIGASHLFLGRVLGKTPGRGGGDGGPTAEGHLERGMDLAGAAGDSALWVACAIETAAIAVGRGELDRAASLFDEGRRRAEDRDNPRAAVACCLALGILARQRRDEAAAAWLRHGKELAERSRNKRQTAQCLLHLGRVALEDPDPDPDAAAEQFSACLTLLDPEDAVDGDPTVVDLVAVAWRDLARTHAERDEHAEAVAAIAKAIQAFGACGNEEDVVGCLLSAARWCLLDGDEETAVKAMADCARLDGIRLPLPLEAARMLAAGDEALARRDAATAASRYRRALGVARGLGSTGGWFVVDCLSQLGRTAHQAGDLAEAGHRYEQAIAGADQLGDPVASAHLTRELGRVLRDRGDGAGARGRFAASAKLAGQLGELHRQSAALAVLLTADLDEDEGRAEDAAAGRALAATRLGRARSPRRSARAENHPVFATARARWEDRRWLLRIRSAEGETPFTESMVDYLGPPAEDVVKDMAPRRSALSGVVAVANPVAATTCG